MISIREEQPEDFTKIKKVNDLAFKQKAESLLITKIRQSEAYIPELSLVAVLNKTIIVGHILFSHITIDSYPSIALAPVAVLPQHQGRGIGSLLIQQGIKVAKERGFTSVVVLGHADYYPKFGFKKASDHGISAPFEVSDEAFMVLELVPKALKNVNGIVKYSEAFNG
ncbi:GNAT family N-acetyltransferase [Rossellomorea aquimaris]|uniref:GNAT family N-acetyltransferase n=1 Tax=Rossellomorea aquimaris TaxID=189382 RepID=UPI0007D06232|nr:N-acetyltransferase [Rossellomorea aquimaris]